MFSVTMTIYQIDDSLQLSDASKLKKTINDQAKR